jgi:ribosomal protein L7/L12
MDEMALNNRLNALIEMIARVEKKTDFILKQMNLEYHDPTEEVPLPSVVELLKQGNMLAAIQEYRRIKGSSLNDARAAVEMLNIKLKSAGK